MRLSANISKEEIALGSISGTFTSASGASEARLMCRDEISPNDLYTPGQGYCALAW
jgi:hypothetical protein